MKEWKTIHDLLREYKRRITTRRETEKEEFGVKKQIFKRIKSGYIPDSGLRRFLVDGELFEVRWRRFDNLDEDEIKILPLEIDPRSE